MEYTCFVFLTTELFLLVVECALAPDISLEGRFITNNESKVLTLICLTNIEVQLCTVEFLIEKKTHDNIRFFDKNCYQTMAICSPAVCTCSNDCKSFTLNVTVTQDMMNHLYSCASRIESEGVIYSANISVIHDGNGSLTIFKKIVVPSNIVNPGQKTTTLSPEIRTVSTFSVLFILAFIALGFLSCLMLYIIRLIVRRKTHCKSTSEHNRNSSTIDDLGSSVLPTPECPKNQDTLKHVKYTRKKEKRLTVSTISTNSGSLHSLDNITFVPSEISSSYA